MIRSDNPAAAGVFRRNAFAGGGSSLDDLLEPTLRDHIPSVLSLLCSPDIVSRAPDLAPELRSLLRSALEFSRLLHSSEATSVDDAKDGYYKGFTPELESEMFPRQVELIKRCLSHENEGTDVVGACVFPVRLILSLRLNRIETEQVFTVARTILFNSPLGDSANQPSQQPIKIPQPHHSSSR